MQLTGRSFSRLLTQHLRVLLQKQKQTEHVSQRDNITSGLKPSQLTKVEIFGWLPVCGSETVVGQFVLLFLRNPS